MNTPFTFSVLLCTYNRPQMLEVALDALIERTYEKPDQVVVVNGGDESADQIVSRFMGKHGIQVDLIKTINKNLATSRNIGLAYCSGEIVAMTDDDAEVFPDWVTQMKRIHAEHPEAGGVGGAVLGADSDKKLLSRIADVAAFSSPSQPSFVRTIAGVNVSYKRSVLQAVGLQDESFFINCGEDVDFNWRIKQLGYEIFYHPGIKVLHHHRPTLKQFIHQFYMYGRAYYLVRSKWLEMYCVYPHGFSTFKDMLKATNFLLGLIYQPFLHMMRMTTWKDRLRSLPLFFAIGLAWKGGMVLQRLKLNK